MSKPISALLAIQSCLLTIVTPLKPLPGAKEYFSARKHVKLRRIQGTLYECIAFLHAHYGKQKSTQCSAK